MNTFFEGKNGQESQLPIPGGFTVEIIHGSGDQRNQSGMAIKDCLGDHPMQSKERQPLAFHSPRPDSKPISASGVSDSKPQANPSEGAVLSPRQREIMSRICNGLSTKMIAEELSMSEFTVKDHLKRIKEKLKATNTAHAAAKYRDLINQSE